MSVFKCDVNLQKTLMISWNDVYTNKDLKQIKNLN